MGVCYDTTSLPKYLLYKAWFFTTSARGLIEQQEYEQGMHFVVLSTLALLQLSEYDTPADFRSEADQVSQMNKILASRVKQETGGPIRAVKKGTSAPLFDPFTPLCGFCTSLPYMRAEKKGRRDPLADPHR